MDSDDEWVGGIGGLNWTIRGYIAHLDTVATIQKPQALSFFSHFVAVFVISLFNSGVNGPVITGRVGGYKTCVCVGGGGGGTRPRYGRYHD